MPVKLSTTIRKIQLVPNASNRVAITAFHDYLMGNDLSVHHVNNNLKAAIAYANYLGTEQSFHQITNKEQVISFLDTKRKLADCDPEMRWITTWNYYLNRLRFLFRWFHNRYIRFELIGEPEWETPEIVRIKSKKSKRVTGITQAERPKDVHLYHIIGMFHYEPSVASSFILTLEDVKTMSL